LKLLHIQICGWTATFRLPLLYSGTGLTSPLPPYSTLLGLLGALAGREITPNETRIGFVFRSHGTAIDRESLKRLRIDNAGRLGIQPKPNNRMNQFHICPRLDLYLDNTDFRHFFDKPCNPPCLGRSQDVAWIKRVREVEAAPVQQGEIRGTLVPFPQSGASGQILVLPDYFDNNRNGYTRTIGMLNRYLAIKWETPARVAGVRDGELLNLPVAGETVYMHQLR
jgi:CRISPR-associated Cas5-like protein